MHGDQVVAADELVQLDVVHVAARADLRGVQHGEHVVGVDVDFGDVVALDAVAHRDAVKAEHPRQRLDGGVVARRDVDPDDRVLTLQQLRQLVCFMPFDTRVADHENIHSVAAFRITGAKPHTRNTAYDDEPGLPRSRPAGPVRIGPNLQFRLRISYRFPLPTAGVADGCCALSPPRPLQWVR